MPQGNSFFSQKSWLLELVPQKVIFFLCRYPNYLNEILKRIMKRRALILPVSVVVKGKRYENSMDYQSIQWFNEIMENQQALR